MHTYLAPACVVAQYPAGVIVAGTVVEHSKDEEPPYPEETGAVAAKQGPQRRPQLAPRDNPRAP